jgi:hypothetical protein
MSVEPQMSMESIASAHRSMGKIPYLILDVN